MYITVHLEWGQGGTARFQGVWGGTRILRGRPRCRPGPIPVPPLIAVILGSTALGAARAPRPPPRRGAVLADYKAAGAELEFAGVDPGVDPDQFQFRP